MIEVKSIQYLAQYYFRFTANTIGKDRPKLYCSLKLFELQLNRKGSSAI